MGTNYEQLVRELRTFRERRELTNATARGIRKAVAPARKAIKEAALGLLPKGGGLNIWVSKVRITASIKLSGRRAGVKLKGGRNSLKARTDTNAIDRGRVRGPSWGRRTKGSWHTVTVTPGFFTKTATDLPDWRADVDKEVDKSLDIIRRGR